MTYAELVQKIRDYTEVSSNVLTNTIIDGFINDSEFKILNSASDINPSTIVEVKTFESTSV